MFQNLSNSAMDNSANYVQNQNGRQLISQQGNANNTAPAKSGSLIQPKFQHAKPVLKDTSSNAASQQKNQLKNIDLAEQSLPNGQNFLDFLSNQNPDLLKRQISGLSKIKSQKSNSGESVFKNLRQTENPDQQSNIIESQQEPEKLNGTENPLLMMPSFNKQSSIKEGEISPHNFQDHQIGQAPMGMSRSSSFKPYNQKLSSGGGQNLFEQNTFKYTGFNNLAGNALSNMGVRNFMGAVQPQLKGSNAMDFNSNVNKQAYLSGFADHKEESPEMLNQGARVDMYQFNPMSGQQQTFNQIDNSAKLQPEIAISNGADGKNQSIDRKKEQASGGAKQNGSKKGGSKQNKGDKPKSNTKFESMESMQSEDYSENSSDFETEGQPKRRGRKKEKDENYFKRAVEKIEELKEKLKNAKSTGMPVKERQRLRNQVSAQQSRIKKKEEVITLNNMIKDKDNKMQIFINDILLKKLQNHQEIIQQITHDIENKWPASGQDDQDEGKSYKRQKTEGGDVMDTFKAVLNETFITNEQELEKFLPNDCKESD